MRATRLLLFGALVAVVGVGTAVGLRTTSTTTTTTTTSTSTTTTTTTVAPEAAQAGWQVATRSARGVMVDYRMLDVGSVYFRAIRLRARTTLLRWHVGGQDPPTRAGEVPADALDAIDWASEGLAGVVAVFNGGFKADAHAGGSMVDGVVTSPMVPGDMTIALDAAGHWRMGLWEPGFPGAHFHAIAYRQNLGPMIADGQLTAAARTNLVSEWGSPLKNSPLQPRSALGVDAHGNLVYVATMTQVSATQIAEALLAAGATEGMELDINPYWPIAGASFAVLHAPGGYPVQIPYSEHDPTIYNTGWERDFFVALAEPGSWRCRWVSPGLSAKLQAPQPQPLHEVCAGATAPTTTTSVAG